ncbi:hypothetical protein JCM8097_000589 [Rhodosporidiobolus ruineniae]
MPATATVTSAPVAAGKQHRPARPPSRPHQSKANWLFWLAGLAAVCLAVFTYSSPSSLSSLFSPSAPVYGPPERVITPTELRKHIVRESAWVAIDGQVWDVTNTIMKHPAGPNHIIRNVGSDITDEFRKHHHREGLLEMLEREERRIWRVGVMQKREEKQRGWKRWVGGGEK